MGNSVICRVPVPDLFLWEIGQLVHIFLKFLWAPPSKRLIKKKDWVRWIKPLLLTAYVGSKIARELVLLPTGEPWRIDRLIRPIKPFLWFWLELWNERWPDWADSGDADNSRIRSERRVWNCNASIIKVGSIREVAGWCDRVEYNFPESHYWSGLW